MRQQETNKDEKLSFFEKHFFLQKKEEDKNHFLHSLNGSKHLQQDDRCQDDVGLCLLFLKNFLGRNLSRKFDLSNSTSRHDGQLCWRVRVRIPLKFLCQLKVWKYWIRGVDGPRSTNCTNNIKFYSARIICISKTVSVTDHHSLLGKISKWSIQPISDFKMSIGRKLSKRRFH